MLAAFAGLRPLLQSDGHASARSREHAILEPAPGVLAVVGGKYTTYRAVAEAAVDRVSARLGRRAGCSTARVPLPGGDLQWSAAEHWNAAPRFVASARELATRAGVPESTARHWLATHGSRAPGVAALAAADPALATPLCPHQPHAGAEVVYAVREEMALRLEDWFLRRSRVAFGICNGLDALAPVAALFARELAWSAEEAARQVEACRDILQRTACRLEST